MDTNTRLRSAAALTATEVLTAVHVTPMVHPLELHVIVPTAAEAGDTLTVSINFRNSATTSLMTIALPAASVAAIIHLILPFFCDLPTLHDFVVTLTCTNDDSVLDFNAGVVQVWISPSLIS